MSERVGDIPGVFEDTAIGFKRNTSQRTNVCTGITEEVILIERFPIRCKDIVLLERLTNLIAGIHFVHDVESAIGVLCRMEGEVDVVIGPVLVLDDHDFILQFNDLAVLFCNESEVIAQIRCDTFKVVRDGRRTLRLNRHQMFCLGDRHAQTLDIGRLSTKRLQQFTRRQKFRTIVVLLVHGNETTGIVDVHIGHKMPVDTNFTRRRTVGGNYAFHGGMERTLLNRE